MPADPRLDRARMLMRSGRGDEALRVIDAILADEPDQLVALSARAALLVQQRRLDAADQAFAVLTACHPGDWTGWLNHGHLLKTLGRIDAAIASYRRAIALASGRGIAWWGIANLKPRCLDRTDIARMTAALVTARDDDDRLHLHFALGRALDVAGEQAAAFEHFRHGNALRRARAPHDADAFAATIRRTETVFDRDLLAARSCAGADARDPIFIVGMPRSGSTLVEQILASHPLVEGTEELHALHRVAQQIAPGGDYLDRAATLPAARLRELGEHYLAEARRYRTTDRPFFTDKMPSNWIYAGLIRLILPNARIVDVRRHPMACGFANFAQHYGWGNNFAYDLTGIGRFYGDYVRHMAHYDRVAPGLVHRVHYEALVADTEGEVRRLLAYLDLPFDAACLRFHETARAVHTPSSAQVRRPINTDGLDRWRAYAPWLGELEAALGPVLTHYPAPPPAA